MSNELVPVKSAADFRLVSLIRHEGALTRSQEAAKELLGHFDSITKYRPKSKISPSDFSGQTASRLIIPLSRFGPNAERDTFSRSATQLCEKAI
jgi:hypothetical protein